MAVYIGASTDYVTIAAALPDATGKVIVVDGGCTVDTDTIVPANVGLHILKNTSYVVINSGKKLEINGTFTCGSYKAFIDNSADLSKGVKFGVNAVSVILPEWWGATGDDDSGNPTVNANATNLAINSAPETGASFPNPVRIPVQFAVGSYNMGGYTVNLIAGSCLQGSSGGTQDGVANRRITFIKGFPTTGPTIAANGTDNIILRNFGTQVGSGSTYHFIHLYGNGQNALMNGCSLYMPAGPYDDSAFTLYCENFTDIIVKDNWTQGGGSVALAAGCDRSVFKHNQCEGNAGPGPPSPPCTSRASLLYINADSIQVYSNFFYGQYICLKIGPATQNPIIKMNNINQCCYAIYNESPYTFSIEGSRIGGVCYGYYCNAEGANVSLLCNIFYQINGNTGNDWGTTPPFNQNNGAICIYAGFHTIKYNMFVENTKPDIIGTGPYEATYNEWISDSRQGVVYSRGSYEALPGADANLTTVFTDTDYTNVAADDEVYVSQLSALGYAIYEFKDIAMYNVANLKWEGQSNTSCTTSPVYLQIYNRNTLSWVNIASDTTTAENTDFTLEADNVSLTNYKDVNGVISCRVWQQAL